MNQPHVTSVSAPSSVFPQGQNRAEEGNGPLQEAGAGRPTAGPQNQRKLSVWLHWGPGGQAALSGDLPGEHWTLHDNSGITILFPT